MMYDVSESQSFSFTVRFFFPLIVNEKLTEIKTFANEFFSIFLGISLRKTASFLTSVKIGQRKLSFHRTNKIMGKKTLTLGCLSITVCLSVSLSLSLSPC